MEAMKEQKTLAELSSQFGVHAMVISKWKKQGVEILTGGFSDKRQLKERDDGELIQELTGTPNLDTESFICHT